MSNQDPNQPQEPQPPAPQPIQQPTPTPYQQPAISNVQPNMQADMVRAIAATRTYYGAALWTLALYWIAFWIGGVIANIIYLNSANNAQKLSGVSPEGKGCLWILLITHVVLPIVGICLFYLIGFMSFLPCMLSPNGC